MLFTHLAATLLLAWIGSRVIPGWDARAWMLAILFGVAIDVDHLLEVPAYLAQEVPRQGWGALSPWSLKAHGAGWISVLHSPFGGALALSVAVIFQSPAPFAAWLLHKWMDWTIGKDKLEFAGPAELSILAVLVTCLAFIARAHVAHAWPGVGVATWLRASVAAFLPARRTV